MLICSGLILLACEFARTLFSHNMRIKNASINFSFKVAYLFFTSNMGLILIDNAITLLFAMNHTRKKICNHQLLYANSNIINYKRAKSRFHHNKENELLLQVNQTNSKITTNISRLSKKEPLNIYLTIIYTINVLFFLHDAYINK